MVIHLLLTVYDMACVQSNHVCPPVAPLLPYGCRCGAAVTSTSPRLKAAPLCVTTKPPSCSTRANKHTCTRTLCHEVPRSQIPPKPHRKNFWPPPCEKPFRSRACGGGSYSGTTVCVCVPLSRLGLTLTAASKTSVRFAMDARSRLFIPRSVRLSASAPCPVPVPLQKGNIVEVRDTMPGQRPFVTFFVAVACTRDAAALSSAR